MPQLTNMDFDYYIYMYYLIIHQGFRIEDTETYSFYGMLEWYSFKALSEKYKSIDFYICNPRIYRRLKKDHIFAFVQRNVRPPVSWRMMRRLVSCVVPFKKLRRKVRG